MKNRLVSYLWLWLAVMSAVYASDLPMRSYTIELPHHLLHFSLPEEIAKEIAPIQMETRFTPDDQAYRKDGFRVLAFHLHDFNGPFWIGAYGSLKFDFVVLKRSPDYQQEITTLPGVERYVRWWIGKGKYADSFSYDRGKVGEAVWAVRRQNTFGKPPTASEPNAVDLAVFSYPLDANMFLEAGFRITEWVPGSAKKWKEKADALREAIKATIILETKSQVSHTGQLKQDEDQRAKR